MVSTSSAKGDPLVGTVLGQTYLVLERLGAGGMAVVYLVEHQTLHKQFAAKVLSSQHASSLEARARFTQEAHAASNLDHENIVGVSDFGVTDDDQPYFVMELLRGKTLADRLDEGPMTLEEVVAVAVPVARALAHSHAEGIVHRDVKPENIFLVQRSRGRWGVKVLDFGIAKVSVTDRMTKTGEALGSPMFMAPEACRGEEVDQRADIYSFGIVMYLMLAGRVPFQDENLLKVLQMQVVAPLPLPSSFNNDIPANLEMVIIRALAKDADDRYTTMDEFLFAFEAALPQGSDAMLLQAQFGSATTPFPGSLERVRNSGIMTPPSFDVTGQHAALRSATKPSLAPAALPPAPARRSRGALVVGTLVALGAASVGGYLWMHRGDGGAPASGDPAPTVATATDPVPTVVVADPTSAPKPIEPPTNAIAVPQDPAPDAATLAAIEPLKEDPDPVDPVDPVKAHKDPRDTRHVTPKQKEPTPKPVAIVKQKLPTETGTSTLTSDHAGSASVPTVVVAQHPTVTTPVEPVAKVTHPVVTTPTVTPTVTPTRPVTLPVATGSMDATPSIANLDVNGPLPGSVVRRGIERVLPALRDCYRTAAATQKRTPPLSVTVTFEIDESSTATSIAGGAAKFGSLSSCVRSVIGNVVTRQAPDVGIAQVGLTIKFTPN